MSMGRAYSIELTTATSYPSLSVGNRRQPVVPFMPLIAVPPPQAPAHHRHVPAARRADEADDAPPASRVVKRVRFVDDNQGVYGLGPLPDHYIVTAIVDCLLQGLDALDQCHLSLKDVVVRFGATERPVSSRV